MKTRLLIGILVVTMTFPTSSHAFALLRYTYDAMRNQVGLDRGPIPKIAPVYHAGGAPCAVPPVRTHPPLRTNYIQAEGF